MTNSITNAPLIINTHSSSQNGKSLILWILDTGATEHITSTFTSFLTYYNINPIFVTLPYGSQIDAFIFGSVSLSSHITLHNVLHIPTFSVNLIYVAKLTTELSGYLFF